MPHDHYNHLFEIPGPGMSRDLGGDDVGEMYTCASDLAYESFSDAGESRVWFASKNLTPCRMH